MITRQAGGSERASDVCTFDDQSQLAALAATHGARMSGNQPSIFALMSVDRDSAADIGYACSHRQHIVIHGHFGHPAA